ncbi:G-type lectin S-receptor-like serine/threonine-protein kinase [Tanacetum coccineum]
MAFMHMLLLCFSMAICFTSAADTISANHSLSGNQTITSKNGHFVLGFFKPGDSSNYYVGIWYKNDASDPYSIVWVANREIPVSDRLNSELKIIDGNLVLLNEFKIQIWPINVTNTNLNSVIAVIHDDGNLVLTDESNSAEPVWQSFDHLVNTWLPGAKLAYDFRTKKKQLLTSWKSKENPDLGLFSLEFNPNAKELIGKRNGSRQYWRSGAWNGTSFNLAPDLSLEETGWPLCNCLTGFKARSESDYWIQNDFSGGCVRKMELQCGRHEENSNFIMVKVVNLPSNKFAAAGNAGECHTTCMNNCSCNAYSFANNECSLWDGDLLDLSEDNANGKTIYVKVASKDLPTYRKKHGFPVGAVTGSFVGLLLLFGLILLIINRKKRGFSRQTPPMIPPLLFFQKICPKFIYGKTTMEGSLLVFVYRDLLVATKNFSHKLGGGGFGSVYKGVLYDSSIMAVKKLESITQGEKQFRSEVSTIGNIQHVRLRGFCAEGNNKLLVYDYMPNGSLDSHLFSEKQDNVLNWKTRYQIALGTARGLVYLHDKCRNCIIDCDIKPENILLDADLNAQIADFGLAKLVGRDFSRVLTIMRGTRGYLAPEWLSGGAITAKADVFSYGMMLFELGHGKRNTEIYEDSNCSFFPSLAASVLMAGGDILSLIDSRLNRVASVDEVMKILKVAYWCIQDEEDNRPSMSLVEHILEGVSDVNMPPIPKYVNFFVDKTDHDLFFTKRSSNGSFQSNFPSGGDFLSDSASSS